MKVAAQICDDTVARDVWSHSNEHFTDSTIVQQIIDLSPKIDDTMVSCRFRNEMRDCNDLFAVSVTDQGFCYSFNALNNNEIVTSELSSDFGEETFVPSSNWNMERGYTMLKNVDTDSYPYRVFGTNDPSGLTVVFRISKRDMDDLCCGPVQGFRIKFHNPSEDPQLWKRRFNLSPDTTKVFQINAQVTKSTDDIRKYSSNVRQCYYSYERKLRFFKVYSKQNCETECLANYTLNRCGCVKFSMPSKLDRILHISPNHNNFQPFSLGSNETKICGLAKLRCILDANSQMFQTRSYERCQCLQSCSWLQYSVTEFQTPDNLKVLSKMMAKNDHDSEK